MLGSVVVKTFVVTTVVRGLDISSRDALCVTPVRKAVGFGFFSMVLGFRPGPSPLTMRNHLYIEGSTFLLQEHSDRSGCWSA